MVSKIVGSITLISAVVFVMSAILIVIDIIHPTGLIDAICVSSYIVFILGVIFLVIFEEEGKED